MAEFEALRQWDSLLLCLRLLDKSAQALDLVQRRLQACLSSLSSSLQLLVVHSACAAVCRGGSSNCHQLLHVWVGTHVPL